MTFEELEIQVDKNIAYTQKDLADSPRSALIHLNRGIGYVQAVGEMMNFSTIALEVKLENAMAKLRHEHPDLT